jgi:hypothetical protein
MEEFIMRTIMVAAAAMLSLAARVESLRREGSDANGAKRTCRERRKRVDLTK